MANRFDPAFTFDTFVVGPSNRLAAAAARRAAESPGTSYNPLIIQGGSGLGKTHLLHAIGQLALNVRPELHVVHETIEEFIDRIAMGTASGTYHFQDEHLGINLLLLDGAQELAGKGSVQAEMLWIWDAMIAAGAQVVLVSDRPLADVDEMDQRLLSQFSGGLMVDVEKPTLETRAAIVRQRAAARNVRLGEGVAEALGRLSLENVPRLLQQLDRLIEAQEAEGRSISAAEVFTILGAAPPAPRDSGEFNEFLEEISTSVAAVVEAAPWRNTVAEAILHWSGEGIRTSRIEAILATDTPPDVSGVLASFEADVERLREIQAEIALLSPARSALPIFQDPEQLAEAEALLRAAQSALHSAPSPQRGANPDFAAYSLRPAPDTVTDAWFFDVEKIAWSWLALDDRILEEFG